MSRNYFVIERDGECYDHVMLRGDDGSIMFENYLDMDYNTMKYSTDLEDFVCAIMTATDKECDGCNDQTIITLVGEDSMFIWGIMMGSDDDGTLRYILVDWKKDGKGYRYAP